MTQRASRVQAHRDRGVRHGERRQRRDGAHRAPDVADAEPGAPRSRHRALRVGQQRGRDRGPYQGDLRGGRLDDGGVQKPDVALAVSGAFIISTSFRCARTRILTRSSLPRSPPSHPAGFGGAESRAQFQLGANNRSPVSRTPRAASDLAPARSAPSSRTTPCVSFSSPVSYSARR